MIHFFKYGKYETHVLVFYSQDLTRGKYYPKYKKIPQCSEAQLGLLLGGGQYIIV